MGGVPIEVSPCLGAAMGSSRGGDNARNTERMLVSEETSVHEAYATKEDLGKQPFYVRDTIKTKEKKCNSTYWYYDCYTDIYSRGAEVTPKTPGSYSTHLSLDPLRNPGS